MAGDNREREKTNDIRDDLNRTSVEFLLTDVGLGLTFVEVAETAVEFETKERNIRNARKAHDYVETHRARYVLTDRQRESLISQLAVLKTRLEALGQTF